MSGNRLKDIPNLDREGRNLDQFASSVQEALQTFRGTRGDPLDKALTLRDMGGTAGVAKALSGGQGTQGIQGIQGAQGPAGGAVTPDLTPPPTPTGLAVTSGFANLFIEWTAPVYTQGHGHKKTNIYGRKYAIPGALPVFTDAVRIGEAFDARTLYAHPTELGTNWAVWLTFQSVDNVESSPAGGANGVRVTIGKIGNVDLGPLIVQAGNLADQAVSTTKMTVSDFSTIADNPTFEAGDVGWTKEGNWAIVNSPANAYNGNWCATTSGAFAQALRNAIRIPTIIGDEFYAEVLIKTVGVTGSGGAVRVVGFNAAGVESFQANGNFITGTVSYGKSSVSLTIPVNIMSVQVELLSVVTAGTLYADNIRFQRKLTLNHLAANSIAVGTLAVQNGALVNAMIGTAAIDDAKIGNLSAAKLTAGDGTIGGNLKSSNYVGGSLGWIVQPSGFAEFSNIVIRGATYTGTIYAGAGLIGGWVINTADFRSSNYMPAATGSRFNQDGSVEIMNLYARGNIQATSLNAATGSFGSVIIAASGSLSSGQTAFNTGTGFFLGLVGGVPQISIGSPTGPRMNWDGTTLDITDPSFNTFTASIPAGALNVSVAGGSWVYGSRSVFPFGGKAPYTYLWVISDGKDSYGHPDLGFGVTRPTQYISQCWITGGSTASSATIAGANYATAGPSAVTNYGRLICFVSDVNGRVAVASCSFSAAHTTTEMAVGSGGEGGSSP